MTSYSFDANILIDALMGFEPAREEIRRGLQNGARVWVSRMVWIEVMSKGSVGQLRSAETFLSGFGVDELDAEVAARAATLRRDRQRLRSPDAIILASAQLRGHILVTRNTKDFPVGMPGIRVPYTL
ncbi:type II toxin-antitoxin system VapC family toxin [Sphingomonas oligophenolica]|uniref:Type II toxin-antitoxin system VapC family toxin n=1 Tax=Sphingomonas oligophenolica TaxID=301154 RepID=A0A502CFZ4_9SPHN|nr:type II toxin-antitoxin system VapC family toxin [Sphingomonas oligophenolica]TPG12087.1 type II toxin-antitoxin system VapC family toxin [Sphingomonas oligophenolica]